MLRLLILLSLLALAAVPAQADGWTAQWRAAIRSSDPTALSALAGPGRDVDLEDRRGRTGLMVAASKGDVILLRRLLELGADVDRRNSGGGTALMFAAQYDKAAAARLLLEYGARINLQAAKGWTALMIAALKGSDGVIDVLMEKGADPNIRDAQGFTPLMRAVTEDREGAVRRLLSSNRVQVNATDERGIGALHLAAAAGKLQITRILLARGAGAGQRDGDGNTPRSLAEAAGHTEVLQLLEALPRTGQ